MEDAMDNELGTRLRAARTRAGLSQRQLAKQSGVTNATISMIESGRINPSVGSLKRVLSGIPMGLSEFFADGLLDREQVFFSKHDLIEIGKGKISYRQIGASLKTRKIQLLHERYEAGADTGKVPLTHDGEECGLVLRGRVEVIVGDRARVLGPGDIYYFSSRIGHRFRNVGKDVCEIASACTPPSF
jgi:transcriptional regulator with XRE-family HTH domain